MTAQIQVRRDTSANWTSANPILKSGEIGLETDTGNFKMGDGVTAWTTLTFTGMKTWASYTPTFAQSGAVAKTVSYGKYIQNGKTVYGNAKVTSTAAGTASNAIAIGLPITAASSGLIVGTGTYFDTGANEYRGPLYAVSTTTAVLLAADALQTVNNVALGVTPAITVASGDIFNVSFQYEAA